MIYQKTSSNKIPFIIISKKISIFLEFCQFKKKIKLAVFVYISFQLNQNLLGVVFTKNQITKLLQFPTFLKLLHLEMYQLKSPPNLYKRIKIIEQQQQPNFIIAKPSSSSYKLYNIYIVKIYHQQILNFFLQNTFFQVCPDLKMSSPPLHNYFLRTKQQNKKFPYFYYNKTPLFFQKIRNTIKTIIYFFFIGIKLYINFFIMLKDQNLSRYNKRKNTPIFFFIFLVCTSTQTMKNLENVF
eukprot:TRINITY_DN19797_c0_g1_i4.p1 TRINITY_DN19797_c0_g1~~TRINITY_DN19797_c0_g1_i4.p1  ORF type:complete len:240 (+),score=-17.04 TRINITY_DN19797_c0_g1_i4:261-980(+)